MKLWTFTVPKPKSPSIDRLPTSVFGNRSAVLGDPHLSNALRCSRIGQSIKPRPVIVQDLSFGIVG